MFATVRIMTFLAVAVFVVLGFLSTNVAEEPQASDASRKLPNAPVFDGKSLAGWRVIANNDFERHGKVELKEGELHLAKGRSGTGVVWEGDLPRIEYEVTLEAKRTAGDDFFCGLTFPVRDSHCTLILGGWGGSVTGLSNIDGNSAVENETTGAVEFKNDQWYKLRLRVAADRIQAWIDKEKIVDVETADKKFSVWWEQEPVRPFGIATWNTSAAIRKLTTQRIEKQK